METTPEPRTHAEHVPSTADVKACYLASTAVSEQRFAAAGQQGESVPSSNPYLEDYDV